MSTILDEIVAFKREEVAYHRKALPQRELEAAVSNSHDLPRGFARALAERAKTGPAIIAEIKRGSPSLGCIRPDLVAEDQAEAYSKGGAAAISVLTDRHFFFAKQSDFWAVRKRIKLPLLRKDFMIDDYQIYESRAIGADCVLLIMAILTDADAARLGRLAHDLGMDVLAETHTRDEIHRVLDHVPFDLIGVNNRNLGTFTTRTETTLELAQEVPDRERLVAESGLHGPEALRHCWRSGVKRFLVGEAFVRSTDPTATVHRFAQAHELA